MQEHMGNFAHIFSIFHPTCMMPGTADVPKNVSGLYECNAVECHERHTLHMA